MSEMVVENLSYSYKNNGIVFSALHHLNVTVQAGEFVSVIGHSGCGKSTLLKVFAGLLEPAEGAVFLDGKKMHGPDTNRAVVFQEYSLFPWMTVLKNVVFGIRQARKNMTKKEAQRVAMEYLEKVGMADAADKYPYQLSGGMRQRVAIARALAMDADMLLLDEPFGALDVKIRMELQDLLLHLCQLADKKITVIFVTHDIEEAILLGDRVLFMRQGEIVADRPVSFVRPRDRRFIKQDKDYTGLKEELTSLFYLEERNRSEGDTVSKDFHTEETTFLRFRARSGQRKRELANPKRSI